MSTKITMPQLGESVAEGTVGRWFKHEGDVIKVDESLVEIITDKVTAELPSPVAGRVARILGGEDQTVRVGTEIAEIEEDGVGALAAGPTGAVSTAASSAQGGADSHAAEASPDATAASVSTMTGPGSNGNGSAVHDRNERISPLARRLAQEYEVDLHQILGTGEGGRVRKEDILAYVGSRERPASALQTAGATMPRPAPEQQPPAPSTPQRAPDVTFRPTTFAPSGPPAAAPSAPSAAAPLRPPRQA